TDTDISTKTFGGSTIPETEFDPEEAVLAAMDISADPLQMTIKENPASPSRFRHLYPTACSMQSPLKRRCIDMDEDDDDLPLLDQNLATPIFKSGFATKLYQESRRQKFEQQAQKESEQQKQPQQQHQDKEQLQPQSQQQHASSPAKQATESKKDHQQHPTSQHRQQPQTDNRRRQQSQLPRQLAADNPHSAPDYNENLSYSQVVRGVKNVAPICNLQSTTPSAITPKYAENSEKSSYSRVVRGNGIPAARPRNPAQKHLNKLQQQLRQRQQQRPAAKKSSATPSKQTAEIRAASSNTYNQVMSGDISTDRVRNPAERHLAKLQQQLRDEQQQLHVHAVDEVFQLASGRFANSLANHVNPEARNLILNPYEPGRLNRPRYLQQLEQFIRPLQSECRQQSTSQDLQQMQHLNLNIQTQTQRRQVIPFLPTLLRLEEEELDRREAERLNEIEARRQQQISNRPPPARFCEMLINTFRKRYRDGQLTREAAVALIQGQPPAIQRLIVPDYVDENQETQPPSMQPQRVPPTQINQPQREPPIQTNQLQRARSISILQPPVGKRLSEEMINIYRRKYRDGIITRDIAISLIWDQPPAIQQIVVPDYVRQGQIRQLIPIVSLTESQPSQQTPSQLPPQMSNPHLTQQPILSQREAPANVTRNDSHEILLNHRLEQTRRELIRVLDDDEAAEQRRAHTNPLTIHRRRRRTLMSRNNIAPNILLLGWSILTSLSTPPILRISRAVSKPCTIRKPLFPIALRHLDGISALQLPAASQPYSLDETLDIQKTTSRCSMTPPMHLSPKRHTHCPPAMHQSCLDGVTNMRWIPPRRPDVLQFRIFSYKYTFNN
ncbi:hypothetical protein ACLKA6_003851, partial [Drosophila palustris]